MSNTTMISTTAITLNFISLIGIIFMGLICIFMLSMLVPSIIRKHDLVLILVANNYLGLLAFALAIMPINIDMVRGDYNLSSGTETFSCRIKTYIMLSFVAAIFNSFLLQAALRFFRVVYPSYVWLQRGGTYAVIIPILWLISFISIIPIHVWHDIQYIPRENTCLIAIHSARGLIWSNAIVYGIPVIFITIIYIQLTRFIRQSSKIASTRAKRDVIVIRRIMLVVCILMLMGIPSMVLRLMLPFTDVGKPLFYRIQNMAIVAGSTVLSFMLVYVTPQVKVLIGIEKTITVTPTNTQEHCLLSTKSSNISTTDQEQLSK
ncbi:unnamed protein product [Rotaria sp. Silwood2]|nr:unnamed protein product [Rotaria sp. Silwood2]CAF2978374.1 unnamed protein product [Rotaria sp. Silwood2]CAF3112174.1 unnamed protein product [Rotaria sp. Silwood2]CAF3344221.1 unnamed protein product [Rotaria sp. Silwood2]CAF4074515.1 unnamed protein product [Rotaria sp. Silwood2]